MKPLVRWMLVGILLVVHAGCAGPSGHQIAFSTKTGLVGNSRQVDLSPSQALRVTKQVLVRQGFTIDSVDANAGLVKAARIFRDPTEPDQSYNIQTSAYVFENGPESSMLTVSASQQTILHREWKTWWHLLWIIPVFPVGTEYQTVVTQEGNVTDPGFYTDFFSAVVSAGADVKAADRAADRAATQKAAAEKAAAEKIAAERAAAERLAAEKAAAEKIAAERAAAERAIEGAAIERAVAEKVAAEKAAAERAARIAEMAAEMAAAEKPADVEKGKEDLHQTSH